MIERNIKNDELDKIKSFLLSTSHFNKISPTILEAFMPFFKIIGLNGGETLITEGDVDSTLYILYQGRLRLFKKAQSAKFHYMVELKKESEEIIGEISPGEVVGEMSFLIGTPRSASVRAMRDSILLKVDHSAFEKLKAEHPECILEMSLTSLNRLLKKPNSGYKPRVSTIAIIPAGDSDHIPFIHNFIVELNKIKPSILINKKLFCQQFNKDINQIDFSDDALSEMNDWLYSLEQRYGYVVFETDRQMTPWSHRCIREADKLLLIAEENAHPTCNSIEIKLFSDNNQLLPNIDLVILHPENTIKITNTQEWLNPRDIYGHHHLRIDSILDMRKLIRFLFNRALGVVLNGGGAKAFAHLGVLKALEERKIPIDFIGGSSMGALLGGVYARVGLDAATELAIKLAFGKTRDVTLPILSLLKGGYATDVYLECFGSSNIEDLWTRFFCVSTNLSNYELKIHESGLLWKAVRASTSIPAIYPPVSDENNHILVDGAVINNMPVDIMKKRNAGGKVLAVNSAAILRQRIRKIPSTYMVSGWKLLIDQFNPFKKYELTETIYNILVTSLTLVSSEHQKRMEAEADYLVKVDTSRFELFDFKLVREIIEVGYQAAMEQLPLSLHTDIVDFQ